MGIEVEVTWLMFYVNYDIMRLMAPGLKPSDVNVLIIPGMCFNMTLYHKCLNMAVNNY